MDGTKRSKMLETVPVTKENCIRAAADGDVETLRRFFGQHHQLHGLKDSPGSPEEAEVAGGAVHGFQLHELCLTLFHEAIENGQLGAVHLLLETTVVKAHCVEDPGLLSDLLAQAIVEDYSEIVDCLLQHGADPNRAISIDDDGEELPPLSLAARLGSLDIADLLVCKGASVAARKEISGATALHEAAQQDEDEMIQFLVESGANVNAIDDVNGETALHVAVKKGSRKAVAALIKCRANLNVANKRGSCAVHIATVEAQTRILELLISAGAETDRPKTPRSA